VRRRRAVLEATIPTPDHAGDETLKFWPSGDDHTNCNRALVVERLEVDQVPIEERVLVVPLHLDGNTRKWLGEGARPEHVDLVAADFRDRLSVSIEADPFFYRDVLTSPYPLTAVEHVTEGVIKPPDEDGPASASGSELIEGWPELFECGLQVVEPIRKRLLKDHIGVASYTIGVPLRQTVDGRWPYLPGEVENLFRLMFAMRHRPDAIEESAQPNTSGRLPALARFCAETASSIAPLAQGFRLGSGNGRFAGMTLRIPTQQELMWPVLQAMRKLGGSAHIAEISTQVAQQEGFSNGLLSIMHTPSQSEIDYRLGWARTRLKQIGAVVNSSRGVWALTELGQRLTESEMEDLDKRRALPPRNGHKDENDVGSGGGETDSTQSGDDPEQWKSDLLDRLLKMSPDAFERLAQRLLREAGFRNVEVLGRSGDGGPVIARCGTRHRPLRDRRRATDFLPAICHGGRLLGDFGDVEQVSKGTEGIGTTVRGDDDVEECLGTLGPALAVYHGTR